MLNTWIQFNLVDGAIKERACVIPQDTQFVDECTLPHHKLKLKYDSFLKTDKFKNCTIFVFLEYWSKFVQNDLKLTLSQQINDYTAELMNDKLDDFLEKYYIKSTSKNDYVVLENMYNTYIQNVPQGNFPIKLKNFKEKVISKKFVVDKVNKGKGVNRVNKIAVLYIKENNEAINEAINIIDDLA